MIFRKKKVDKITIMDLIEKNTENLNFSATNTLGNIHISSLGYPHCGSDEKFIHARIIKDHEREFKKAIFLVMEHFYEEYRKRYDGAILVKEYIDLIEKETKAS